MMKRKSLLSVFLLLAGVTAANAKPGSIEEVKAQTEKSVKKVIQPLLNRYCGQQCKILGLSSEVQVILPEETAPGFQDLALSSPISLEPESVVVNLLVDEMVGPNTRQKLLDLIDKHFESQPYTVTIETTLAQFPQPPLAARKVSELREQVVNRFTSTLNKLFNKFCPKQCLLADYVLKVTPVNTEEVQYGSQGEYIQEGDTAIRIQKLEATVLLDTTLTPKERQNILEIARLRTNYLKNVDISSKIMNFPDPALLDENERLARRGRLGEKDSEKNTTENKNLLKSDSKLTKNNSKTEQSKNSSVSQTQTEDNKSRKEKFERYEKIERVEQGDKVIAELEKFKKAGLIFAGLALMFLALLFLFFARRGGSDSVQRFFGNLTGSGDNKESGIPESKSSVSADRSKKIAKRYEIDRLKDELLTIFSENPKVAKTVFAKILTEEGVEITADYISILGESVVLDLLRDPSLQRDLSDLMEFYAKNSHDLSEDETLELLKYLHNRTVAAKMLVIGKRSSSMFDFLIEMDELQILELIRNESLTVKAIALTQCDPQKRDAVYSHLDSDVQMKILGELSRIDHLPKDYIFNVATALKRKRTEDPRLNTEALPGSEVLLDLLEKTNLDIQKSIIKDLETHSPEGARNLLSKIVSIDTLLYLRDHQLLEVMLGLKHDELLNFLRGSPEHIRNAIFTKAPKDLVAELEDELQHVTSLNHDTYKIIERKILNRIKVLSNDGHINLVETNERMYSEKQKSSLVENVSEGEAQTRTNLNRTAGW